jgi:hypothetical protein
MTTIFASRKGQSLELKLRDSQGHDPGNENLTTDVKPNNKIQWMLDENSGLESLDGIYKVVEGDNCFEKGATDLLVSEPIKKGKVYEGTIVSESPGYGKFEKYKIAFKVFGDEEIYFADPKLQMNA